MRILGIDPGLADLGYGIIDSADRAATPKLVTYGVVQTPSTQAMAQRLDHLYRSLCALISEFKPDEVAVEELFFSSNIKTAIVVAQARGVAILATAQSGIPLSEYSPPRIKQALVGHGGAGKPQIQMMVRTILGMKEIPKPDHAADALAVALCHLQISRSLHARAKGLMQDEGPPSETQAQNKLLLGQARGRKRR